MYWSPDLRIGLRLAIRARFTTLSLWMLIALTVIVLLAAQFSGRQPATVALDVGLSTIRLMLPLVIILLAQELLSKEFDRRYFLSSLTYPRPRHWLFLGRIAAMFILTLALLGIMALTLGGLITFITQGYDQATPVSLGGPYLITLGFIVVDLFVLSSMAAFLCVVATTPSFILIGTLGFMLVARSYSNIMMLLAQGGGAVSNPELYYNSLGILSYLLPDLAAMDVRMVALYNSLDFLPTNWLMMVFSVLAYGFMLIGLALWGLQRKRFS